MTRTPYYPQRDGGAFYHWEMTLEDGEVVDTRVEHCPLHPDHLLLGCAACSPKGGTDDADA